MAWVAARLMALGGLRMLKPTMHAPQAWAKSTSDWDMGPTPTWTIFTKTWQKKNIRLRLVICTNAGKISDTATLSGPNRALNVLDKYH